MHRDKFTTVESHFDVLVVGDANVGKTSLIRRFVFGSFIETEEDSEDLYCKIVDAPARDDDSCGTLKEVFILDSSCSADQFLAQSPHQVHNALTMLFAFSLDSRDSYEVLEYTINCISTMRGDSLPPCIIVGTKLDRYDHYQVSYADGQELALRYGALSFVQISAKDDSSVDAAFAPLLESLMEPKHTNASYKFALSSLVNTPSSLLSSLADSDTKLPAKMGSETAVQTTDGLRETFDELSSQEVQVHHRGLADRRPNSKTARIRQSERTTVRLKKDKCCIIM